MKKKKRTTENGKLYYIEEYLSVTSESKELFTWEDVCELKEHVQLKHPENQFEIREFEPI